MASSGTLRTWRPVGSLVRAVRQSLPVAPALATFLGLTLPLAAQAQFAELGKRNLPTGVDLTYAIAHGDLDGDGDEDVVVGNRDQARLYRNLGDGVFEDVTATNLPSFGDATGLALADVDGDGDLDLAVCHFGGALQLLRNLGNGVFVDAPASLPPFLYVIGMALVFADVDHDGDSDLVVACIGQILLLRNNGAGVFTDVTAAQMPSLLHNAWSLAAGDFDGDGDLDLVLGGEPYPGLPTPYSPTVLLVNSGSGTFTDGTVGRLPVDTGTVTAVALADIDGDGDLDLAVGKAGLPRRLFRNQGTGTFVDVTATHLPAVGSTDFTFALSFGDVDHDGDLDLACGNDDPLLGTGRQDRLFTNDGTGNFTNATAQRLPVDDEATRALVLFDADGDLDLDLLVGNHYRTALDLNDGSGVFCEATPARMPTVERPGPIALGDVDGDGDLDAVFAGARRLYRNDGSGTFTDITAGHLPLANLETNALVLRDVDGDGDLDLVLANGLAYPAQNRLYQNDGTGTFTNVTGTSLPQANGYTGSIAAGDVDGDGDLDLALSPSGVVPSLLYRNDGSGHFTDVTATQLPTILGDAIPMLLVDVDLDGDLDLVRGAHRHRHSDLYDNDGTGTFVDVTAARMPGVDAPGVMVVGDVDADGDPDLLVSGNDLFFGSEAPARLYCNLHRQVDAPFVLHVGRPWRLDAMVRNRPPNATDLVLPFFSTTRVHVPLPPFGTLGIDPNQMLALPPFLVAPPAGSGTLLLAVPNVPALAGIVVHVQALFDYQPLGLHLSNVVTEVLRQ